MTRDPGWYDDGHGNERYFDGERFTKWVDRGFGHRHEHQGSVPLNDPRGSQRNPLADPPPGYRRPVGSSEGSSVLALVLVAGVAVFVASQFAESLRWYLLVCGLVLSVVLVFRLLTGGARSLLVASWVIAVGGALWGFQLAKEDPPWDLHREVEAAQEILGNVGEGIEGVCTWMPPAEQRRLAERHNAGTCEEAVKTIGERTSTEELRRLRRLPVTVLEPRRVTGEEPGTETIYYRVQLAPNSLGWRYIEFTTAYMKTGSSWNPEIKSVR
jgi:hypothetical protein